MALAVVGRGWQPGLANGLRYGIEKVPNANGFSCPAVNDKRHAFEQADVRNPAAFLFGDDFLRRLTLLELSGSDDASSKKGIRGFDRKGILTCGR